MLCMSKNSTISIIEALGDGLDDKVMQWKDNLMPRLTDLDSMEKSELEHSQVEDYCEVNTSVALHVYYCRVPL